MLAVVEHQQPRPCPPTRRPPTSAHGLARLLGDAQHRRHCVGYRRRVGDRGQLEKPDTVRELIGQTRRDLGRQPGLADPAYPGQRHQPMSLDRRLHLGDLGLAPDEACGRRPQIPRTRIECPQRRKVRAQARRSDLEHPDRRRHVPQPSRPQIHQINSAEQTCRRVGQQDLTTVPRGHHPCGAIEHRAEVIPVAQLGFAGR